MSPVPSVLLPNSRIVSHQRSRERSSRRKKTHSCAIVAVRVDGWNVFNLLEAVHFVLWVLEKRRNMKFDSLIRFMISVILFVKKNK